MEVCRDSIDSLVFSGGVQIFNSSAFKQRCSDLRLVGVRSFGCSTEVTVQRKIKISFNSSVFNGGVHSFDSLVFNGGVPIFDSSVFNGGVRSLVFNGVHQRRSDLQLIGVQQRCLDLRLVGVQRSDLQLVGVNRGVQLFDSLATEVFRASSPNFLAFNRGPLDTPSVAPCPTVRFVYSVADSSACLDLSYVEIRCL